MRGKSEKVLPVKKKSGLRRKEEIAGSLFALPAIIGVFIWFIIPMVASFIVSLSNWDVISSLKWVGFQNYLTIFTTDPFFKDSIFATFYFGILSAIICNLYTFIIALLLNASVPGTPIFRTIFYLPTIVPAVASNILWRWLYNPDFGLLNQMLAIFGIPKQQWIYDTKAVIPSLVLMAAWGAGNGAIIFLSGLQNISGSLYEAAEIDGAGYLKKLFNITIPMMSPIIFYNMVMGLIGGFQAFTQAYMITGGGPNNKSLFIVYYIYRTAFQRNSMGYACALAFILFLIILLFTAFIFKFSKNLVYYEEGDS